LKILVWLHLLKEDFGISKAGTPPLKNFNIIGHIEDLSCKFMKSSMFFSSFRCPVVNQERTRLVCDLLVAVGALSFFASMLLVWLRLNSMGAVSS